MIPRRLLGGGERELGVVGDAFLQGVVLAEVSPSKRTVATERRVVMLDGGSRGHGGSGSAASIFFQVPWSSVNGYWTGVLGFPPELWREGPEGKVVVLVLDPGAAGGKDVVIRSNLESWVSATRDAGIPEIVD
ncbi:MAG: hypothetical protein KY452_03095 [Actinobacteria bacterium]|nr:hypothetical protein [Actinomycetota bacterium]